MNSFLLVFIQFQIRQSNNLIKFRIIIVLFSKLITYLLENFLFILNNFFIVALNKIQHVLLIHQVVIHGLRSHHITVFLQYIQSFIYQLLCFIQFIELDIQSNLLHIHLATSLINLGNVFILLLVFQMHLQINFLSFNGVSCSFVKIHHWFV